MKTLLILLFSSAIISQGAIKSDSVAPQKVTEISPKKPLPIPEPSTVLLTIMAGALGVLRRKRS